MPIYRIDKGVRWSRREYIIVAAIAFVLGGAGLLFSILHKPVIPESVTKQADYAIFYPQNNAIAVDKQSMHFDTNTKVFTYQVNYKATQLTISQQATLPQFADVPAYYPAFVNKFNAYDSIDTSQGHVDLTRPEKTNQQTAIMNSHGTLMFVYAPKDLSSSDWKRFFNTMKVVQPAL